MGRDPRCRTVSVAYYGLADKTMKPTAGDDARKVQWFEIKDIPSLAFDHNQILNMALTRFVQKVN
jgi:8-oxo-dGTP diphosphatase